MLTEFGLCYPNMSDPLNKNNLECTKVLDLADSYFQSWTYWDFKPFWNTNGDMIKDLVSVFSRPYPIATAGIPKKMNFVTTPQSAVSDVVVERNPEDKATVASKEAKPKTQILSRFRATRINQ